MSAVDRWADALAAWAIPEEILDQAPESPWGFPPQLFTGPAASGPTQRRALESLPDGGVLLDVGSGTGAASLGIAPPAGRVIAVDQSPSMLAAMRASCPPGVELDTVEGRWPDVASDTGVADVAVSAHVVYNVADLDRFVVALTEHTRCRVVLELAAVHPGWTLAPLWAHFWGIEWEPSPTADDALAVVAETGGVTPASERWERPPPAHRDPAEVVAWARRRLCLSSEADSEIASFLGPEPRLSPSDVVTMWWDGSAG